MDNVLIFSANNSDHWGHVKQVLGHLRDVWLFAKITKCVFTVKEVNFLEFVVLDKEVSIELSRVDMITE